MRSHALTLAVLALAPCAAFGQSTSKGFTKTRIAANNGNASLAVGPDGHLYVADVNGRIKRHRLNASGGFAGATDTLVSLADARILGIAFDPDATASSLVLYASVNLHPRTGGDAGSGGEWNGKIVKFTLPPAGQGGSAQAQDKVVNLPTGFHDVNDIAFGPDKKLYVCAGSTTTLGGTGRNAKDVKEKLLSAAILQVDVKAISGTLDVKTEQGGSYNPFASGAKVRLHATGLRNAYDCAWLDGNLYAGINQNDVNGNTGGSGGVPNLNDIKAPEPLVLVRPGKYYGHVNATRGEHVHMGGNPTSGADPWEIAAYPVGTKPDPDFDPSLLYNIAPIGGGNADGCVGYDVPGPLQGRLVVCLFGSSGGGKVMTFTFGADGRVTSTEPVKDGNGNPLTFNNPLDVALHPNGNLYVGTYGTWDDVGTGGEVYLLTPINPAPPPTQPTIARSPTTLSASVALGQDAANQSFQVWNSGTGTLTYSISDNAGWLSVNPTSGVSTGSADKVTHTASFDTSGLPAGTHGGTITVSSASATNTPRTIAVSVTVSAPANAPPVVDAGPNQTLPFPSAVTLDGAVTDDGLPSPPGAVTATWTKQSGPGTVTFADPNAPDTTASFSAAGTYVLRLSADDGALTGSADVTIALTLSGNAAPSVTASADRATITLGETVRLSGSATDDGLPNPPGSISFQWTLSTGPNVGVVTFADEHSPSTTAAFSDPSTYTLRLTASDGALSSFAEVTVQVLAPSAPPRTALFVVGNTTLGAGDAAVKSRLESQGFTITLVSATAASSEDAAGKGVVLISSTCVSGDVNTKFRDVAVPVLTWEAWLYDDLGMTGPEAGVDYGQEPGQTQLDFVAPSHPLAGGLSGTVTITGAPSGSMWGKPGPAATVVATLAGDPTKAAVFAYESGASMPGMTAPARRVGLPFSDTTAASLTGEGWSAFDTAVSWTSGASAGGSGGGSGSSSGGGCGALGMEAIALLGLIAGGRRRRSLLAGLLLAFLPLFAWAGAQQGAVFFSDDFGPSSRGALADNPVDDAPTYFTTSVPRGYLPSRWVQWDTWPSTDGRSGFWAIPEGAEYLEQAGRSADSALFAQVPVPQGTLDYDVSFRQWRGDNDYIGYILGAESSVPSTGVEFGYEIQTPGTDTTTDDVFYRGVLGSGVASGQARHRAWAAHRIEVRGTRVRWLQDGALLAEGDVPGLRPGGYFGLRQKYERGTRYEDVVISAAWAAPPPSPAPVAPSAGSGGGGRDNPNGDSGLNDSACGVTGFEALLFLGAVAGRRRPGRASRGG